MKSACVNVAAKAIALATGPEIKYSDMKCDALIEKCINDTGGGMGDTAGINTMVRKHCAWLGTIENAKAEGKLLPGAGLLINEGNDDNTPEQFKGDGLGDFSHGGIYVGEKALYDEDKNGKSRLCNVVHSSSTMKRVAGSTLANGWTHVILFSEVDYGVTITPGVTLGAEVRQSDEQPAPAEATVAAPLVTAVVYAANGKNVKLRPKREKGSLYWEVACDTTVSVEQKKGGWALITAICTDGATRRAWMMEDFLKYISGR